MVENNRVWLPKLLHQPSVKQDGWINSLVPSSKEFFYSMSVSLLPSIEKVNYLIQRIPILIFFFYLLVNYFSDSQIRFHVLREPVLVSPVLPNLIRADSRATFTVSF